MKLTKEQKELFNKMGSPLRQQTAVEFIKLGFTNRKQSYIAACEFLNRKVSRNPETSGCEILGYPKVVAFLDSVRQEAAKTVNLDAAWVLESAKKVFDRCMQEEEVLHRGEPTGEFKFEAAGANKALELIGRHTAIKAFEGDATGSEDKPINIKFVRATKPE
tara:strand:- start:1092 stop:1577 length:486 start_codon:yes stop_codon:yes gene_type:complete